ncbi:MAG TPA: hypothetical protein VEA16_06430 [Vicinamibacterales bacterium]|nr:hypothetical protein [Vicinamibacterales bacterium]
MKLANPQTFAYEHANFNGGQATANLNANPSVASHLDLVVTAPDGRKGGATLQFQDNGEVVIRIRRDGNNPLRVLVVGDVSFEG